MELACTLCPRACGAVRSTAHGYCGANDTMEVASVCVHQGEEPPLNPIVNIFFAHCNLHCIYCQNHQISTAENGKWVTENASTLADRILTHLSTLHSPLSTLHSPLSTPLVGFVTAAHYADRIPDIIGEIRHKLSCTDIPAPAFVYNSSGYESVDTLRSLEGLIDIYLPDYKYADPALAAAYSHAPDYPDIADAAIQEMIRQVGSGLKTDDNGTAYRGIIVRHLVLPGHTDNSIHVLDRLADIIFPPSSLHLSLMAQYYPPKDGLPAPLDRTVAPEEYAIVTTHAAELGFTQGWVQELTAQNNYRPDFNKTDPFNNQSHTINQ